MFVIVLENHSSSEIVGDPDAPFLNRAYRTWGVAANYQAVAHPSQPNYIAMTSGSTQGVTSDDDVTLHVRSILDQVKSGVYMQSLVTDLYARKHDPAAIYGGQAEDFSHFLHEPVAPFTFISPDLCHDMHGADGCSDDPQLVRAADTFVASTVSRITHSSAWTKGSFVVVTFDEGSGDNHVLTLVLRKGGKHVVSHRPYTHYSLLRTIEAHFGVPCLLHACAARPMSDLVGG